MFHRITYEAWTTVIPIAAFCLTAFTFLFYIVRAFLMNREEREHLANLPLENETLITDFHEQAK